MDPFGDMLRGSLDMLNFELAQLDADVQNFRETKENRPAIEIEYAINRLSRTLRMVSEELAIYERCTTIVRTMARAE